MHATDSRNQEPACAGLGPYTDVRGIAVDRSTNRDHAQRVPQSGFEHFSNEWVTPARRGMRLSGHAH